MSRNLLPWTNFKICSYCSFAWPSLTRSILFCKIRMCFSFMISIAAKCSDVCGWGHDSFPAKQTLHSYYLNQQNMFNTFAATWPEYRSRRLCSLHTALHTNNIDFVCLLTLEMVVHLRSGHRNEFLWLSAVWVGFSFCAKLSFCLLECTS